MLFSVELSELAEKQYDNILSYILNVLKNPQALEDVMDDFDDTVEELEKMADTRHRYLLVYRVIGSKVIIEGIYHELLDYENSIM